MARRAGKTIFNPKTIFGKYAFHFGGGSEIQFNIGIDGLNEKYLRYGIAFSFQTSRAFPDINELRPQVRLFNDFLALYPNRYARMKMWHWDSHGRSMDYVPSPIPSERIANKVFVFLGLMTPLSNHIDVHEILRTFDDLLPLYCYVISNGSKYPINVAPNTQFEFKPGCSIKKLNTTA